MDNVPYVAIMYVLILFDQCISLNARGFNINTRSKDGGSSCDVIKVEEHG